MARRSESSARSLNEPFTDPLVPTAHAEGRRSRAVFKLEEPDPREKLPDPGVICLDLCTVPRGKSVQGDLREREALGRIPPALPQRRVALVLSGVAPPLRGIDAVDRLRPMCLAEPRLDGGPGLEARAGCPDQGLSGLRMPGARSGRPRPFRQGKADQAHRFILKCICWRRVFAWCSVLQAGPGSGVDKLPDAGSEAAFEDE